MDTRQLLKASLSASRDFFRVPGARPAAPRPGVLVPIRSLGPAHRGRILRHLMSLEPHDRYLRFGYAASDTQIQQYVARLDFDRDEIFGIYNRRLELIAMAHLAHASRQRAGTTAEFGVSVLRTGRGRGLGSRLFDRAVMSARNAGVELLLIHALSENAAMLRIARRAGATVERHGSESEALLRLPQATLDTRMAELVERQYAEMDFQLKQQAKHFRDFIDSVQEVRGGLRAARHQSGS
ncbi:MAG: GNAT family N-acetyltransferase [Burkholderiales bacterium]|jgi:GNAT superfamily N-acetyltransferase|nr:GNAT family N-acetyltransferase [Burkholderiales bacterium]